ncbi:MAG: hypothetical protein QG640_148 [Patescibacteria group bacterium]|nr:hypothetical protein [Patescibacteria group bacterium]
MKKLLLTSATLILLTSMVTASVSFVVTTEDDVPAGPNKAKPSVKMGLLSLQSPVPLGQEAQYLHSGPVLASPNITLHRANVMAGMFGVNVPTDRNNNPAAWYRIPTPDMAPYGWQWFDGLSTGTNKSWKGATTLTNPATAGEFGHRMILSTVGTYPASAYTVTISSSLTNIAPITFGIATNSGNGAELLFGPQYVGVDFGTNGVNESTYSVAQGRLMPGGDDTVLDVNQSPSSTNYNAFARFGASVAITSTTPAAMEQFRQQFISSNHWFKVELKKNGVLVASNYVESALAMAMISPTANSSMITIGAHGGQENSPYSFETRTNVTAGADVWVPFSPGTVIYSGGPAQPFPVNPEEKRFFRLVAE